MLHGYDHRDHYRLVQDHLHDLRREVEDERRARLSRESRTMRYRLGRLLIAVGMALGGAEIEGAATRLDARTMRP